MKSQIKKTIAILLLVCFVVSLTATAVSASSDDVVTDDASQCFNQPIPDCPNGQAECVYLNNVWQMHCPGTPGVSAPPPYKGWQGFKPKCDPMFKAYCMCGQYYCLKDPKYFYRCCILK